MSRTPHRGSAFLSLMLVACLVRLAVVGLDIPSYKQDPDSYARLARGLAASGVLGFETLGGEFRATAFRPPLYPWLLAWLVRDGQLPATSVALLHFALGIATVWLTYSIAGELKLSQPWLPGLAVALDPLLLRDSQLVMTETLAAFLAVLVWRLWLVVVQAAEGDGSHSPAVRRLVFFACGLALGLSILARPTAAPWALLCAGGLLWVGAPSWKSRVVNSALVCLAVLACIVPWTLRNAATFGKPIWATTHGGYTLLLANNPELYAHFRANGPSRGWNAESFHADWAEQIAAHSNAHEVTLDQVAYAAATASIRDDPTMFVVSCIYRIGWLWALWPYAPDFSVTAIAIGIWYFVWFALAIRGGFACRRRKSLPAWLPALALLVSLTAVHAVYWSNMRMRAPMMSVIYLLAVVSPLPRVGEVTILSSTRKKVG